MTAALTDILFVSCTGVPKEGLNHASTSMRRHVMQNYITRRNQLMIEEQADTQVEIPAETPTTKHSKYPQIIRSIDESEGLFNLPETETQATSKDSPERDIHQSSLYGLEAPSSLPVQNRYVAELIDWHFNNFLMSGDDLGSDTPALQVLVLGCKQSFWTTAVEDINLFFILLCYTDSKRAAFTGQQVGVGYYVYKGMAIKAIQALLSNPPMRLNQSSITLMACLAALAFVDDGSEVSRVHMQAIVGICTQQDEIPTLTHPLFQHLIWHDFRLAWATFQKPLLRYNPCDIWAKLPLSLLAEAHRLAMATSSVLPTLTYHAEHGPNALYLLFNRLHQICLSDNMQVKPNSEIVLALTNLFYWVCYKTSVLVAQECNVLDHTARSTGAALMLATQLFLLTCVPSQLHVKLYKTRRKSLSEAVCRDKLAAMLLQGDNLISSWTSCASLESLLWILAVCTECSRRYAPRNDIESAAQLSRLLYYMRAVMTNLQITDKNAYERVLLMFPWTKRLSVDTRDVLWGLLHPEE